jgi:hypothetical protein
MGENPDSLQAIETILSGGFLILAMYSESCLESCKSFILICD